MELDKIVDIYDVSPILSEVEVLLSNERKDQTESHQ